MLLGRFTVALRVMIPGLAGMARLPYRRFAVANVAGATAWGAAMVVLGYLAGSSWRLVAHQVSLAGGALTAAVLAALVLRHLLARRADRRRACGSTGLSIAEP